MGASQSQKAGDGVTQAMAGRDVNITQNLIGLSYADVKLMIAEDREHNIEQVWARAQEMLREAGVQPGPVPLKTLVPLLQYASIEEDEYLQAQWAALLANAAIAQIEVHTAYPDILRQLSPIDARLLDLLFDQLSEATIRAATMWTAPGHATLLTLDELWNRSVRDPTSLRNLTGFDEALHVAVDNLMRLNLLTKQTIVTTTESHEPGTMPSIDNYYLTVFGRRFVEACRRPRNADYA